MITTEPVGLRSRLARAVLEWLLTSGSLPSNADLCLVQDIGGIDEPLAPSVVLSDGRTWRLAHVDGDFGLRVGLVDAGGEPLLAFTSCPEDAFQADLRERAVLRRAIRPLARHLFTALVGIDATALQDERYLGPLTALLAAGKGPALDEAIRQRSWGSSVRDIDATAIVCAAAFGIDDRFLEAAPGELWARWLEEPPLHADGLAGLASRLLERRYPIYADLVRDAPDGDVVRAFQAAVRHSTAADPQHARLVRDTVRALRTRAPQRLAALLAEAEAAYVAAGSPLLDASPLARAYAARVRELAVRCGADRPPTMAEIAALGEFAFDEPTTRRALERLARLARGMLAIKSIPLPSRTADFAASWLSDIAWLDRAARRAREAHAGDAEMAAIAVRVTAAWFSLRDAWNAGFAATLSREWETFFGSPGSGAPIVLSHVLKHIVRPQLAQRRTLLVVLDGCDLPTFLEILDALASIDVMPASLETALAPLPTVTPHARRAIFGGDIPHDVVGDEDRAAEATGDRAAFEGDNAYLNDFSRRLFLKGDLTEDAEILEALLREPDKAPQVIGVVFNDVDDAIASKEYGVLAERTLDRCSPALRTTFVTAFDKGWRIIVTADHGHTPWRSPDVRVTLPHTRYAELAPGAPTPPGTIVFEPGVGMPFRIAALHQLGAHSGPPHLGYHGGASLEEVVVALAVFDSTQPPWSVRPPLWWNDAPTLDDSAEARPVAAARPRRPSAPPGAAQTAASMRSRCREALVGDPRSQAIFDAIADAGVLDAAQLGRVTGIPPGRVRAFVAGMLSKLHAAQIDAPLHVEDDPVVFRWVGGR